MLVKGNAVRPDCEGKLGNNITTTMDYEDVDCGMSTCTIDDFFDEYYDDMNSLDVDKWSTVSSVPSSPRPVVDNMKPRTIQDLSSSDIMETSQDRMQKCLNDIPHIVTMKLIRSLDIDTGWEDLAGLVGFTFDDISELRLEERKMSGSPSRCLLWKLGCRAYTTKMLYEKYNELSRFLDAEILATYIMEGIKRPAAAQMSFTSRNSDSLQSLMSRVNLSKASNHHAPESMPVGNFHSAGSEVNFNRSPQADNSQVKVAGYKMYGDKLIPGAILTPQSSWASGLPPSSQCSSSVTNHYRMQPANVSSNSSSASSSAGACRQDPSTCMIRQVGAMSSPSISQNGSLQSTQSHAQVAMNVKTAFSYQELFSCTDGFNSKNILGEGGFGVVYYGKLRNLECAVKKFIQRKNDGSKDSLEQIHSELAALLKYQHENIVTLYGYALDGPHLCLVYQYLSNGSLEDRLIMKNGSPPLSWERRINILVGSCKAISFLHTMGSPPLIHGDIKSANILLDSHLEAKFADLGQSRYATSCSSDTGSLTHITIEQTTSRLYGSKAYQAPEIKSGCSVSIKSDIFAMGVVVLEVCTGLEALNIDRCENKFLTDLYTYHIVKLSESERVSLFQDKSPQDCISPSTFLSLLKLAGQCIKEVKKCRPDSGKMLTKVKEIYDDQFKNQFQRKGLMSPTEDDATLFNYQSHFSEKNFSNELNSCGSQQPSFLRMQNERYEEISLHKQTQHLPSQSSTASKSTTPKSDHVNEKCSMPTSPTSSTYNKSFYNQPSFSPQEQMPSCMSSFTSPKPLPEAYLLQEHYDQLASQQHHSHRELASNLNNSNDMATPVKNPVEEEEAAMKDTNMSSTLASDPKKISLMNVFDGYGSQRDASQAEATTTSLSMECDEAKIALMTKFDDSIYQSRKAEENHSVVSSTSRENRKEHNSNVSGSGGSTIVNNSTHVNGVQNNSFSGANGVVEPRNAMAVSGNEKRIHDNVEQSIDNVQDVGMKQCLANRENMLLAYQNMIADGASNEEEEGFYEEESYVGPSPFDQCEGDIPERAVFL